jgi:hypothetical protein
MRTRRVIVLLGLVLGTGVVGAGVVWRVRSGRRSIASAGEPPPVSPSWVEPVDGSCPASHPVKAKVGSGIYHLPGTSFYARTRPERCYVDAAAAEADGYRAAKTAAARSTA